jgi:hypothetical protein
MLPDIPIFKNDTISLLHGGDRANVERWVTLKLSFLNIMCCKTHRCGGPSQPLPGGDFDLINDP